MEREEKEQKEQMEQKEQRKEERGEQREKQEGLLEFVRWGPRVGITSGRKHPT